MILQLTRRSDIDLLYGPIHSTDQMHIYRNSYNKNIDALVSGPLRHHSSSIKCCPEIEANPYEILREKIITY